MINSSVQKNILLTGGLGYIGSHIATVLAKTGHKVVLYDNLSNSNRLVLERLKVITGQSIPLFQADVRDTAKLEYVLKSNEIDAVIHLAGLKSVGDSVKNPIEYYDNNVNGAVSLLKAMEVADVRSLVFSSSATVYGLPQYLPLDEMHPTSATNPYGRSKLHIEEILADIAKSSNKFTKNPWRIVCLRYFNPVGAHSSGLIGENPNGVPNNLMPYIAQVAKGTLSHVNIFGDDYDTKDGTGVRDYIHVMDLAEGHLAALDFASLHEGWNAVNLGTGTGYSVLEMIEAFESASGQRISYRIVPRRAGDIAACYANVDKARDELSWCAVRSLKEMCASAWKFQTAQ